MSETSWYQLPCYVCTGGLLKNEFWKAIQSDIVLPVAESNDHDAIRGQQSTQYTSQECGWTGQRWKIGALLP